MSKEVKYIIQFNAGSAWVPYIYAGTLKEARRMMKVEYERDEQLGIKRIKNRIVKRTVTEEVVK